MVRFPHFSLVNNVPLYIDIDIEQLVYLSIDGNSDCFHVLVIVNSTSVNIGVHVPLKPCFFAGYMPSSGIAKSHGSFISIF